MARRSARMAMASAVISAVRASRRRWACFRCGLLQNGANSGGFGCGFCSRLFSIRCGLFRFRLVAGLLKPGEFGVGAAPGALDVVQVTHEALVRFGGLGIEEAFHVPEFSDDLGFDAAGALQAPVVLGDVVHQDGFRFGGRCVFLEER